MLLCYKAQYEFSYMLIQNTGLCMCPEISRFFCYFPEYFWMNRQTRRAGCVSGTSAAIRAGSTPAQGTESAS